MQLLFIFDLVFVLAPIFVIGMFVFVFCMVLSPKLRSKFMGHQLKIQKQMLEDNKEVIQDLGKLSGEIGVKTTKGIIDENEDDIRHVASKTADMSKDAIATTISAIKAGLTESSNIYCKYCGASIDEDSVFCKKCGKKQ